MELNHWVTAGFSVLALVLSAFNLSEVGMGRIRRVWPHVAKWVSLFLQVLGVCLSLFVIIQFFREDGPPSRTDIGSFVLSVVSVIFYVMATVITALVNVLKTVVKTSTKLTDITLRLSGGDPGDSPSSGGT